MSSTDFSHWLQFHLPISFESHVTCPVSKRLLYDADRRTLEINIRCTMIHLALSVLLVLMAACGGDASTEEAPTSGAEGVRASIREVIVDGHGHHRLHLDRVKSRSQWSQDGTGIYFTYLLNVFRVRPNGSGLALVKATAPITRAANLQGADGTAFGASFDVSMQSDRIVVSVLTEKRSDVPGRRDDFEIVVMNGTDPSVPVEEVGAADEYFDFFPRWSPDETMVAYIRQTSEASQLVVSELNGTDGIAIAESPPVFERHSVRQIPVWGPGGKAIAFIGSYDRPFERGEPYASSAIFTVAPDGTNLRRLTAAVSPPAWSPDGARIAFAKPDGDEVWLFTMAANGSDHRRVTAIGGWHRTVLDWYGRDDPRPAEAWIKLVEWSPDGAMILYTCGTDVCVVTPDGKWVGRSPTRLRWPLTAERWVFLSRGEISAAWSPDSTRIAVGLQPELTRNGAHDIMLYTMSPDGNDVQALVRVHRAQERIDGDDRLHALGPLRLAPKHAYGCSSGLAAPDPANNPGLVEDCNALLKLRDALAGTAEPLNWRGNRPMSTWEGVVIGGAPPRVTALNLANRDLAGTISPQFGELSALRKLDLRANSLSGEIPFDLARLRELVELDLGSNLIQGSIPSSTGRLPKIESLNLADNDLSGPIPVELAQLSELRELHLRGNELTGEIPPEFEALGKLKRLTLDGNRLTGCVPIGLPIDRELPGLPECE